MLEDIAAKYRYKYKKYKSAKSESKSKSDLESNLEEKDCGLLNLHEGSYEGGIKFTRNKGDFRARKMAKGIMFIAVAVAASAVTSLVIVSRVNYIKGNGIMDNMVIMQPNKDMDPNNPSGKNSISSIVQKINQYIVGINVNGQDQWSDDSYENIGSGMIFDKQGHIVTNYHFIEGSKKIMVKVPGDTGKALVAKVLGFDKSLDLAVLKVDGDNFGEPPFGDAIRVRTGDLAIAIGNPVGEYNTSNVAMGIVSSSTNKLRKVDEKNNQPVVTKVIQTDALINQNNSGGPLCNGDGEIIGISVYKSTKDANIASYAIPINEVSKVVKDIVYSGDVKRAYFGIEYTNIKPDKGDNSSNAVVSGVYIRYTEKSSAASMAGIKPTDIIIELAGEKINTYEDMVEVADKHKIGDIVDCKVWRDGKIMKLNLTLASRKK